MPQTGVAVRFDRLDTLRCYAAFLVVVAHILQVWLWQPATYQLAPLGRVGVVAFFVLSGFLIVRLLLAEPSERPLRASVGNFYMRRALRIFPIYYLYLAAMYAANFDGIAAAGAYPWFYLTNIWMFNNDSWLNTHSPLWTLSVEEQFYIVCPFVVLLLRNKPRALAAVFVFVCLAAAATRAALALRGFSAAPQIEVFTLACMDFLAMGGLLALAYNRHGARLKPLALPFVVGGAALYYFLYFCKSAWGAEAGADFWSALFLALGQTGMGVAAAGAVIYALFAPNARGLFHNRATMYLGAISYGVYLYHTPLVVFYADIAAAVGVNIGEELAANLWFKFPVCVALVVAVAAASYKFIETPLLRQKRRFC